MVLIHPSGAAFTQPGPIGVLRPIFRGQETATGRLVDITRPGPIGRAVSQVNRTSGWAVNYSGYDQPPLGAWWKEFTKIEDLFVDSTVLTIADAAERTTLSKKLTDHVQPLFDR